MTAPLTPDLSEAERFLTLLDEEAERFTFQTFDDDGDRKDSALVRVLHGTLDRCAAELASLNRRGAGIFVTVNETDLKGRSAANIQRVRAFFVDLDGSPLEPVRAAPIDPHLVVDSSPGRWHAYWLVADCPLDKFEVVQKALAYRFHGDAKVHDPPRVMRLPGFLHRKGEPFQTRITEENPGLPCGFAEFCDAFGIDPAAPVAPGDAWDGLVRDRPELTKGVAEGNRNDTAASLAGRLIGEGRSREETLIYLRGWNLENNPPLGDAELRGVVASISKAHARNHPDGGAGREPILTTLSDVEPEEVDWLWYPYLPLGKVALLEGHPGYGKTWLGLHLAAAISTGKPLPGIIGEFFGPEGSDPETPRDPANVLFMTAEDGLADTIRPRLDAAGADPSRVVALEGWSEAGERGEIVLDDLPTLEKTLAEVRPALWIIDPLFAYLGAEKDLHRANEVRPVMAGLKRLAEAYNCTVLGIRHLSKGGTGSAILRGLGSIDFAAAVRSVLLVAEDPENDARRILAHAKSSLAQKGDSLAFRLDGGAFQWDGTSKLSADQLLAPGGRGDDAGSAFDSAKEFLRATLAGGPVETRLVKEAAKSAGIAWRTVERAKKTLGVISVPPPRIGEPWTLALPGEEAAEAILANEASRRDSATSPPNPLKKSLAVSADSVPSPESANGGVGESIVSANGGVGGDESAKPPIPTLPLAVSGKGEGGTTPPRGGHEKIKELEQTAPLVDSANSPSPPSANLREVGGVGEPPTSVAEDGDKDSPPPPTDLDYVPAGPILDPDFATPPSKNTNGTGEPEPGYLDALGESEEVFTDREERTAIQEHEGGLPREEAERRAEGWDLI